MTKEPRIGPIFGGEAIESNQKKGSSIKWIVCWILLFPSLFAPDYQMALRRWNWLNFLFFKLYQKVDQEGKRLRNKQPVDKAFSMQFSDALSDCIDNKNQRAIQ